MTLFLPDADRSTIASIEGADSLIAASEAALALRTTPITTEAEAKAVSDQRKAIRAGLAGLKDAITDAFRPFKTFEKKVRDHFAPAQSYLDDHSRRADKLLLAWDDAKQAAERKAREEAEALAKASLAAEKDELSPAVAVPVTTHVPQATVQTRGAESLSTVTGRMKAELVDPVEASRFWPHLLRLTTETDATNEMKVLVKRGEPSPPDGDEKSGGVIFHGIRFWNQRSISSR